ncbi:hypothetical protein ACWGH8_19155 [Nonomuraea muscovyensis]
MTDILEIARAQALGEGMGLDREQALRCLRLPDDRLGKLLALAHEVRWAASTRSSSAPT